MQAVTFSSVGADAKVTTEAIPSPGPGQVLVKTLYAAMNPVDIFSATTGLLVVGWPFTLGADGSGIVTKLGPDVSSDFEVGTTVFGCTRLGSPGHGTAAEYYLMDTQVTFALTPKMATAGLTPVGASIVGAAILTACLGLFEGLRIPLSFLTDPHPGQANGEYILILGGASSVGKSAVQLAVASGYKVLTSCSPSSGPLVEKLGAQWFSYKDSLEDQLKAIESVTGGAGKIHLIFDAVASDDPKLAKTLFESASSSEKLFTTTNDWSGITDFGGGSTYCIELGVIGRPEGSVPEGPEASSLNTKLAEYISACAKLMEEGKVVAGEYEIVGEGVGAGLEAYKYLVSGKAGSKKIVVKVSGEE